VTFVIFVVENLDVIVGDS
jgi:large subunit ribosomal protein L16